MNKPSHQNNQNSGRGSRGNPSRSSGTIHIPPQRGQPQPNLRQSNEKEESKEANAMGEATLHSAGSVSKHSEENENKSKSEHREDESEARESDTETDMEDNDSDSIDDSISDKIDVMEEAGYARVIAMEHDITLLEEMEEDNDNDNRVIDLDGYYIADECIWAEVQAAIADAEDEEDADYEEESTDTSSDSDSDEDMEG